ncbi:hypothetical protein V8C35DRAFT_13240 [Trichoderma chlorosporum]
MPLRTVPALYLQGGLASIIWGFCIASSINTINQHSNTSSLEHCKQTNPVQSNNQPSSLTRDNLHSCLAFPRTTNRLPPTARAIDPSRCLLLLWAPPQLF